LVFVAANSFDYGEPVKFAWEKVKSNFGLFLSAQILGLVVSLLIVLAIALSLIGSYEEGIPTLFYVFSLIFIIFLAVLQAGLLQVSLLIVDGQEAGTGDAIPGFSMFVKFLTAFILYCAIVLIGTLLFLIPGIIWSVQFMFFGYFIVDKELGPIKALRRSSQITKGIRADLFVFTLVIYILNLVGEIAFLVGLFVTVPMTLVALARVYRKLLGQLEEPSVKELETTPAASEVIIS